MAKRACNCDTRGGEMIKRDGIIQEIEQLFPVDSCYTATKEIGQRLLDQAKRNTENWRNLPEEILREYWRLCRNEENKQIQKLKKKEY